MQACLVVVAGPGVGTVLELAEAAVVIGRGPQATIRIDDDGLSRAHAKVVKASDGVVHIVDLESTNGTRLNGDPVELSLLREGDEVRLGPDVVLRFAYVDPRAETLGVGGRRRWLTREPLPHERLTSRELEVARLVADGSTNAVIGARLGISERTVTSHLDHIYTKLGIRSRAALTRHLAESGLL